MKIYQIYTVTWNGYHGVLESPTNILYMSEEKAIDHCKDNKGNYHNTTYKEVEVI